MQKSQCPNDADLRGIPALPRVEIVAQIEDLELFQEDPDGRPYIWELEEEE